eukprot:CAMPEP_0183314838 /NCGR_PEP_ID=MMETSP0160_2-20130417/49805_1 /TAXON_ID=2839 ORGANISM="Odontella Sinensis, Strain Grunow 1884" /NCGR_SAMPLE_ID=MMETSP0160_2 /ASSEMBLY_ACC=CAM_ASM_000250 /LENGTH=81 /DNA_ID=CAMNT_0025480253 /DNA_START=20 /DNA_END=262 /DNA_ORIENTATION=+
MTESTPKTGTGVAGAKARFIGAHGDGGIAGAEAGFIGAHGGGCRTLIASIAHCGDGDPADDWKGDGTWYPEAELPSRRWPW